MDREETSLKIKSIFRRAGLGNVPIPALIGLLVIGLILLLFAVWRFYPKPADTFAVTTSENSTSTSASANVDKKKIMVDIEGAIANPGLYELAEDMRCGDAISAAGGLLPNAEKGSINLAQKINDGEQIYIPTHEEIQNQNIESSTQSTANNTSNTPQKTDTGKININTANATELQTLSGVGPSLSERIIEYREANGRFSSIEDLKKVSGIGDAKFSNIKDKICI